MEFDPEIYGERTRKWMIFKWHLRYWVWNKWKQIFNYWRTDNYYRSLGYRRTDDGCGWIAPDGRYCNIIPKDQPTTWWGKVVNKPTEEP